jgi:CBS domain-containing protein
MTGPVVTVHPDSPISEAAQLMLDNNISGLPVTDAAGRVVGIVTEHDLLRGTDGSRSPRDHWLRLMIEQSKMAGEFARFHGARVDEVMTRNPLTVTEDTPIAEACRLIGKHGIKRLPVVRDGKLIGIVARADFVRALGVAIRRIAHANDRAARDEAMMAEWQRESMLRRARTRT